LGYLQLVPSCAYSRLPSWLGGVSTL